MIYNISHKTTYKYKHPVSLGKHLACLTPRSLPHHRCRWNELRIQPQPATRSERVDYFGNRLTLFTIEEPHNELLVEARSEVSISDEYRPCPQASMEWEAVAAAVARCRTEDDIEAYQFVFESPRIRPSPELAEYAKLSFLPGRPCDDALLDLTARIHRDFEFDSQATHVRTTPEEVFRRRRGVCQDFAHLQIACMRSIGIAARYVSGYLRTYAEPISERSVGADVSHAWVSAYRPGLGWLDVDPTNDVVPAGGHVTLAWGRDYGDISPLRGLILGGRDHTLKVNVDIRPVE